MLIWSVDTWTIGDRKYSNFLYSDSLTPDEVLKSTGYFYWHLSQDYFLRLRHHHRNLLALTIDDKKSLVPSFEGQLLSVVKEIVFLRRRPEFKDVNEIANLLLQPAQRTKRRRLNDGRHLNTGQKGREEEEEVLYQIVDGDEVISPRLLFCKSFDTGISRVKGGGGAGSVCG